MWKDHVLADPDFSDDYELDPSCDEVGPEGNPQAYGDPLLLLHEQQRTMEEEKYQGKAHQ